MLERQRCSCLIGVAPTLNVAYDVVLVGEGRTATQRSELNGVSVEVLGSTYPSESLAAGEGVESSANVDGLLERIVGDAVIVGFLQSCGIDVDVVGVVDGVGIAVNNNTLERLAVLVVNLLVNPEHTHRLSFLVAHGG